MTRSGRVGPGGILLLDKPVGPTSHDLVGLVRKVTGYRKVGHGGTLDPLLLPPSVVDRLAPVLGITAVRIADGTATA